MQRSAVLVGFGFSLQINPPSLLKFIRTIFRFCATRWIEDYDVAVRGLTLWQNIVKLIKHWLSVPVSKRQKHNKSYEMLVKHHLDVTVTAKLHFFKFIASLFQKFLVLFNFDKPLIPFMSASLENVIKRIIKMFILLGVIGKANTSYKLINVDLTKADTCVPPELTMLGTTTNENLKSLHVSNKTKLKLRKHYLRFLKALVQKLQERSLLKYSFVRSAIWLSTIFMVAEPKAAKVHFNDVVEVLFGELDDKVRQSPKCVI